MSKMQTITVNFAGKVRHDQMEGRPFIVAPMTMIVEGVLNGSSGPLLYPSEEIAKYPGTWNHKPIVVYHPQINGQGVSACDPTILTSCKVGVIMNSRFERVVVDGVSKGALKAEAWLEESRIQLVEPRIAEALETNTIMELSTGLFVDEDKSEGEWNGAPFKSIARNFRPDHLALLPDKVGACSVADGAGLLRNQLKSNELSLDAIREQLSSLIGKGDKGLSNWVIDVFRDFFVFENSGSLYQQDYKTEGDKVSISGVPVKVIRRYEYVTANGQRRIHNVIYDRKSEMDKSKIIDELIGNGLWTVEDRATLETLNEDQLKMLQAKKPIKNEPAPPAPEKKVEPVVQPKPAPEVNRAPVTMESYIAAAPPEIQGVLRNGIQTLQAKRGLLIGRILENKANTMTAEQLNARSLEDLEAFASFCPAPASDSPAVNFAGLAPVGNAGHKEEPLPVPTMNFEKE